MSVIMRVVVMDQREDNTVPQAIIGAIQVLAYSLGAADQHQQWDFKHAPSQAH